MHRAHFSEEDGRQQDIPENNKWIQGVNMKKGALHKALGVPITQKIPQDKIQKALHSSSSLMRKRANLAKNLQK